MRGAISSLRTSLREEMKLLSKEVDNINDDNAEDCAVNGGKTAADEGNMEGGHAVAEGVDKADALKAAA